MTIPCWTAKRLALAALLGLPAREPGMTRKHIQESIRSKTSRGKEAVMRVHQRAGHPTVEVYELTVQLG